MTDDDWFDGGRRTLMMWIDGRDVRGHTTGGEPLTDVSWLLVLHAEAAPTTLTLPGNAVRQQLRPGAGHRHRRPASRPIRRALPVGEPMVIPGRTVWLLRADRATSRPRSPVDG